MLRARKRITKKELKHDAMLESIYKVEKYVRSNSMLIMYGGSALLVVIVISVMMFRSKQEAEISATSAVGIAQYKLLSGDFQDVVVRIEDALRKYPGTKAVNEGKFYLASANFQLGNRKEAEKQFFEYINSGANDRILEASAYAGIGAVREDIQDFAAAAENYRKAALTSETPYLTNQYLLSATRNYYYAGNDEEALDIVNNLMIMENAAENTANEVEYWKSVISSRKG